MKEELKAMSTRHLLSNPPAVLADHVRILLPLEEKPSIHEGQSMKWIEGYSNFTICTLDVPGLFSMITGVMAANGINILGAQIHTSTNGKASTSCRLIRRRVLSLPMRAAGSDCRKTCGRF